MGSEMCIRDSLNGDRIVDGADQGLIEATLGASWDRADADGDGVVGSADLIGLLGLLGDSTAQVLLGDITGDGLVDSTDLNVAAYLLSSDDAVADIDGSGAVGISDILEIQQGFFGIYADNLPGDVDGNCSVGGEDVALIEATMGTDWAQGDVTGDGAVTLAASTTALRCLSQRYDPSPLSVKPPHTTSSRPVAHSSDQ